MRGLAKPQAARLKETIAVYRQVFSRDPAGKQVLFWLIERCGLLKPVDTEEQRVLHNYGVELLGNMGLLQGVNYRAIVEAILKFGIPDEAIGE